MIYGKHHALKIIEELIAEGASVIAYDPEAMENVKKEIGDKIYLCRKPIRCPGRC